MTGVLTLAASFDPSKEFELHQWVSIHLGPIDMSINKAVVYLAISALVTIFIGVFTMRSRIALLPSKRQTIGEAIYEVAQTQIAEQGLPTKAIGRWFPYVASLFLFIFTMNLIGFIPLPLTGDTWHGIPTWGIYAVTSQLSVTLVLALLSVVFSHIEGVRYNGWSHFNFLPTGLPPWSVKTAIPLALMYLLEVISQVFRIISLSVRLYANMLAGHMLILVSIGLLFILSGITFWIVAVVALPIGIAFYIFEVVIVFTIQAFIFSALTSIYIGSAIEPEH